MLLIKRKSLEAIANGFRQSRGSSDKLTLAEMATLAAEPAKADPVLAELTVSENGLYVPGDGVDGFNSVTVNVADSGADTEEIDDLLDEINGEFIAEAQYTFTFIGANGEVLCEVPVYDTQDCPDPITEGIITKPTKEPTTELSFTYSHWSATEGGAADSSIFQNVTEDRTVYAVFTSSARIYTIKFWDGETVLKTYSLPYGATPSHSATKVGYVFDSWSPGIVAVTGDANYYAVWSEKITFADGLWEDIARIAESGKAAEYWAIGDTKTFRSAADDFDLSIRIIGFNHDDLADGTGKAGVTVACQFIFGDSVVCDVGTNGWETHYARTTMAPMLLSFVLPQELTSIIKTVRKEQLCGSAMGYTDDKVFIFTGAETDAYISKTERANFDGGIAYPGFVGDYPIVEKFLGIGDPIYLGKERSSNYTLLRSYAEGAKAMYVTHQGTFLTPGDYSLGKESYNVRFGFCI